MSESKRAQDNRADQLNQTHPAYHLSRGASPEEAERRAATARQAAAERSSRGASKKPK